MACGAWLPVGRGRKGLVCRRKAPVALCLASAAAFLPGAAAAPAVGVCLSGAIRTLHEPCVGHRQVTHLMLPLDADVHASVAVDLSDRRRRSGDPRHADDRVRRMVQFALRGARIRNLEVLDSNDTSLSPDTWKSCHEDPWRKQAGLHGFKQAVGLQRCAEWMLPLHCTWIVRLRTDALLPFRLISLPTAEQVERLFGSRGTAITGFMSGCECGGEMAASAGRWNTMDWPMTPADGKTLMCNSASLCGSTDDKFALLAGAHAQAAYLRGYGADFCHWDSRACGVCGPTGERSPEAKLGWSLASRAVPTRDIRFVSHRSNPTLMRSNCSQHANVIDRTLESQRPVSRGHSHRRVEPLPPASSVPATGAADARLGVAVHPWYAEQSSSTGSAHPTTWRAISRQSSITSAPRYTLTTCTTRCRRGSDWTNPSRARYTHTHTEVGPAGGFCIPRRCPVLSAVGGGGGGDEARGCCSSSSSSTAPESRLVSAGGRWPCRMWPTYRLPITSSRKRAETALPAGPRPGAFHPRNVSRLRSFLARPRLLAKLEKRKNSPEAWRRVLHGTGTRWHYA